MLKKLIITLSILLTFAGCAGEGGDGADGGNGGNASVTIANAAGIYDENTTTSINFDGSTVIIPKVNIPFEGGVFDIKFIPTKNNSLILEENAIMITKSIDGNIVDSEWADIFYDVVHKVYFVEGSMNYPYNYDENNVSSIIKAIYYLNGETKIFQSVDVTQMGNQIVKPSVTFNSELFTVTTDGNGNITITENEKGDFIINSITDDDIINLAESIGTVTVSGTSIIGGKTIAFVVNNNPYSGVITDGIWSVDVLGIDLANDISFQATITGEDTAGNVITAKATSIHTVDITIEATLTMNNVTEDNNVTVAESAENITLNGTVTGELESGDSIILNVDGNNYNTTVNENGTWDIVVVGEDLHDDTTVNITASGSDSAGNPINLNITHTHTVE